MLEDNLDENCYDGINNKEVPDCIWWCIASGPIKLDRVEIIRDGYERVARERWILTAGNPALPHVSWAIRSQVISNSPIVSRPRWQFECGHKYNTIVLQSWEFYRNYAIVQARPTAVVGQIVKKLVLIAEILGRDITQIICDIITPPVCYLSQFEDDAI